MARELRTVSDSSGVPILEVVKDGDSLTIYEADYIDRQIQFSVTMIPTLIRYLAEFTEARFS